MIEKFDFKYSSNIDCVSIPLSNILADNTFFRLDSEYYSREGLKVSKAIFDMPHFKLGDKFEVSKLAGFEFTKFFTEKNLNSDDSYIALTSKNIMRENLVLSEFITIDKNVADESLIRSKLFKGDVVLSYTGEYRRSLVVLEDGFQLGPNVCRIRAINNNYSKYLSLFLNSEIGQILLDKEKTLSAQPTVAMSRIREILIPLYNDNLIAILNKCYDILIDLKKESHNLINKAEDELDKFLEFDKLVLKNNVCEIKRFSNISYFERLDAEFYENEYQQIKSFIKSRFQTKQISELIGLKDKNFQPDDNTEYKYLELADIDDNFHIVNNTVSTGKSLPSRARRVIHSGDVLVSSIEGSLQTIAIVDKSLDNSICSTGFFVCEPLNISPEMFCLLLKNKYINLLMKQLCKGTILTSINKDDFLKIELPIIQPEAQDKLTKYVRDSIKCFNLFQKTLRDILISIKNFYKDENKLKNDLERILIQLNKQ